jgi:hypothetical protein
MLEHGSSSQPKQKFERKQRRKQRRRDVQGRRKRSWIKRLSRLLLLPAVQWHPAMPLGPPRLPPKKMAVTTPMPLNSKIRHAEKTRTKNTPELYCCYCCCYHLHNAASSCRRFPTRAPHSSQQLLALLPPHFRTKQDDDDDDKNTTAKLNARYYHPSILTSEYNTDQCWSVIAVSSSR